ncbi:energy transducer TonB [Nitrospirillum iridis]|uniref:TonB family protein n=1 Tax=Nitrospirillum iridis TaxID=765888 RepID=A0A7X0EFF3_9PROT|nr:energy transducer TonB [Nitrospirillum iridis]MBB6252434.1 TonB family protein [Nitrospirillum iridis]
MRTSAVHAVLSGILVVLACWPATAPVPSHATERVFHPAFDVEIIIYEFRVAPPPILDSNQHAAPYAAWPLTRVDADTFHRFPPAYPAAAVKRGEEGRVVFIAFCNAKGHVYDARVWESSSSDRLDAALVKAARSRRWRCAPAMKDGQAVPSVSAKMAYRFQLPDAGKSQHR